MNNEQIKNLKSFLLRIGVSCALLIWLFRKIDISQMTVLLKTADMGLMIAALLVFFVINFFLLSRWFILIKALALEVTFMNVVRFFFYRAIL